MVDGAGVTADEPREREARRGELEVKLVELMHRYERSVFRYLVALARDSHVAEECAQETFVRAYDHLARGKPVSAGWLFRVARSRGIDEIRRRGKLADEAAAMDSPVAESGTDLDVRRALDALPGDDRSLLYLVAVESFGAEEIAALLGISRAAAYMRLSRARQRLRALLREEHDIP